MNSSPLARRKAGRFPRIATPWASALCIAALVLLAGCSAPMNARKDANFQSYGYAADRPTVRPVRSLSSFSDSLMCMDRLFRDSGMPTVLITSKQLPDYSGRVAVAAKEMVVTALSQMSRVSSAFRFVDYEVDIARQDTVQNLTTILLNNNQIQLQRPALYVSGAVSFVDQNVLRNNMDIGTSASRLETGYSNNRNATVIGLELHLGDFRSRTIIPGLDSANEIIIGNGGQGIDLAGRISNYGVQFSMGRDYAQGSGPAMRTLVELGMIELVGKWARLPYWQCLTLDQTHPEFQRQLRDWYDEGNTGVQYALVRRSLISQGYMNDSSPNYTADNPEWRSMVGRYQADNGLVVTGVVDFTTYERALRNFVTLGPDGKLSRVGWNTKSDTPVAVEPGTPGEGYGGTPKERSISIRIENIMLERAAFESGEQIFLSATVSRASYLSCYMGGANGSVIRLLPNSLNSSGWVSAAQSVRIPDWMSPNPGFVMDAGAPGAEGVACFATDADVRERLPEALRGKPFTPITGVSSLQEVNQAYQKALGGDNYTGQAKFWQVEPRRTPAPAAAPAAAAPAAANSAKR